MTLQYFLGQVAAICKRENWADFSIEETSKLRNIFETIRTDAKIQEPYENTTKFDLGYKMGYNEGYDSGYEDGFAQVERN